MTKDCSKIDERIHYPKTIIQLPGLAEQGNNQLNLTENFF